MPDETPDIEMFPMKDGTQWKAHRGGSIHRYMLFAGDFYDYGDGGWNNFIDSFGLEENAHWLASQLRNDWWQIVDTETGKVTKS